MGTITVNHLTDEAFLIDVRGHTLVVDQPTPEHDERGATPVELFVAGLAGCVAWATNQYLREHYQAHDGLRVECEWTMRAGQPHTVGTVRLRILLPRDPDHETYLGIIDAINRCPVRATLQGSLPAIAVKVRSFAEWASLTTNDHKARARVAA
jgi:putative redox protein